MAFSLNLPAGYIAVYGMGVSQGASGITGISATSNLKFGTIYNVWAGGETYVYGGDNVMFREQDVTCRVISEHNPYTILPARLATKEILPP
jgi:hypothetical protein